MNSSEQFTNGNSQNSKFKPVAQIGTPLLAKELATALGVSITFIYQMRACGFPMRGDTRCRRKATLDEARAWIRANNFRLRDGNGVTDATAESAAEPKKSTRGRPRKLSGNYPW